MTTRLKQLWPYIAAQAEPLPAISADAGSTTPFAGSGADIVFDAGAGGATWVNAADAAHYLAKQGRIPSPFQTASDAIQPDPARNATPFPYPPVTTIDNSSPPPGLKGCADGGIGIDMDWLRDNLSITGGMIKPGAVCLHHLQKELREKIEAGQTAQLQPPAISEEQIRKTVNDEITNRLDEIFTEALYKQIRNLINEEISHRCAEITEAKEHTAAVLRNWFALEVERLESIIREERKDRAAEDEKLRIYRGSLVRVDQHGRVIHAESAEDAMVGMVNSVDSDDGRIVTIDCSTAWPKPHNTPTQPSSSIVNTNHSVGNPELLTYATAVLDRIAPTNPPTLPTKQESAEIEYTKQTAIKLSPGALISRIPPAFWHIIVWAALAYLIVLAATKFPL